MSSVRLLVVNFVLLSVVSVVSSQAQTPGNAAAPPAVPQQQVTVRLVLPTTIGLIGEYADILLSKDQDKLRKLTTRRRPRTSNPTLTFLVPIPNNWLTKKLIKDE